MNSQIIARFTDEVEKASVSFWYVNAGDIVEEGKPLIEFVTEKTFFTFESPVSGRILKLLVSECDETPNGTPIAEIETL